MKYVFVSPQIVGELYFCPYTGEGFRLSNRLEDALVTTDPENAEREAERLKKQSGFLVQAKKVRIKDIASY
jgi:hypothetical protein